MNHTSIPTERIACPYCASLQATPVRSIADIVQCSTCQTVYLRTRMTKEAMYLLYQSYADGESHLRLPESIEEARQSGLRRDYLAEEIISFVQEKKAEKGVWFDVGCGWGALLDNARQRGFSPMGIEITRKCLDYATTNLAIPVSNSDVLDSRVAANSCSVVSMVHVLEHLPYPQQSLNKVMNILAPGALFCGIVPNFDSFCSDLLRDQWDWLDPFHHYVHYTPQTLRARLEEAGFIVERIYTAVGDYGREKVADIVHNLLPQIQNQAQALQVVEVFEQDGKGEEIRFFARKPFHTQQAPPASDRGILHTAHSILQQIQAGAKVK